MVRLFFVKCIWQFQGISDNEKTRIICLLKTGGNGKVILSANFAVNDEKWRFLPHVVPNLPVFGPEPALEGHMNRIFCAYSFFTVLQCMVAR